MRLLGGKMIKVIFQIISPYFLNYGLRYYEYSTHQKNVRFPCKTIYLKIPKNCLLDKNYAYTVPKRAKCENVKKNDYYVKKKGQTELP